MTRREQPEWDHECSLLGYKVARDVLTALFIVALFIAAYTGPLRWLVLAISVPMLLLRVAHWAWHRGHA